MWSINRDSPKLDRAGKAAGHWFWHVPPSRLSQMLHFEMHENNFLFAGGSLRQCLGSIPTGGPFSAQRADLHALWGVKTQGKKMCHLGNLTICDEGLLVWVRGRDRFSLAQFGDKVLIASSLSPSTHTAVVHDISSLLSQILLPSVRHLEEGRGTTILELLRRENCISRLCPRPLGSHPTPNTQIV